MNDQTKTKWEKHYLSCTNDVPVAADVLLLNQHLLPAKGKVLDLACGRGGNALLLAEQGLETHAWDISASALEQLSGYANDKQLTIQTKEKDITNDFESDLFDVIVVSRFLDRSLIQDIKNAINSNGLIFYQTFIKDKVDDVGPSNPDYLLDKNELLNFFKDWHILFYREDGKTGNANEGFRNQAMLIARKSINE